MNATIEVAKTCSTCKFAKFTGRNSWWYKGKKQLGICMLHTVGEEPPLPNCDTLYSHIVKHGEMMDIQDYVSHIWDGRYSSVVSRSEGFKYQATTGEGYNPTYFYADKNILAVIYNKTSSNDSLYKDYLRITKEEYMERYKALAESFDPFTEVEHYLDDAVETWYKFNENFEWWQANKDKMRRCHRNTTCGEHVDAPKREPVAKAVANGGHQLEWK